MIELNLLPDELKAKKKKTFELPKLPIIPFLLAGVACLILFQTVMLIFIAYNKTALAGLKKEWEAYAPQRKKIDELKGEAADINEKVKAIGDLTANRILWARKLNALSDSVPSSIWLSKISYEKTGSMPKLTIEGYTVGGEEDVGNFMNTLENNKDFFQNMKDIELGFTKDSVIEKNEVTNFRLICTLKKA